MSILTKIAICDDEPFFLDRLEKMLAVYEKKTNENFIIKRYTKPLQLMDSLIEDFQVFFLDMEMPNMNGFELAHVIRKTDEKAAIIFVTSHREYMNGCFEYQAANYIIKPVTQAQIDCEMNRIIRKIKTDNHIYVAIKNKNGFMKLFVSDIQYIETRDRNVVFHCSSGKEVIGRFKIQDLEVRLAPFSFIRCHNGIIVNADYIESIYDLTIVLLDGTKIYTTKSRKKDIIKKVAERVGSI